MSFLDPKYNVEQFNLGEGMLVADLGVGSGFYTIEAAKIVKSSGRIFAIDIQKDLLDRLKRNSDSAKLFNIEIICGDLEKIGGTKLADFSIDAVIASNIFFQLENKKIFIQEIKRILKPKGKVLVVDWADSFNNIGPIPEHIFEKERAMKLFAENNFKVDKEISAGDHHYGIIFRNI